LAAQTNISFGSIGEIHRTGIGLRMETPNLEWAPADGAQPSVTFDSSLSGGGGVVLNGAPGPQSGYLRLTEGDGQPPSLSNAATLVARDLNGDGRTELVIYWEGGNSEILATEPP
jgi:hypothetical protein